MGHVKGDVNRDYLLGLMRRITDLPPEPKVEERKPVHKITEKQARILDHLIEFGWCTHPTIYKTLNMNMGTATTVLNSLLNRGYAGRRLADHREGGIEWGVTELGRQAAITPQPWAMEG